MVGFCTRSLPCSLRLPFIPPSVCSAPQGVGTSALLSTRDARE